MFNKIYEKIKKFIKENYIQLLLLIFIVFMFFYELPYVIYKSGGVINLSERIIIDKKYNEKGKFNMSYVTTMKGAPIYVLLSFIIPDWDLMPIDDVTVNNDYDETIKIGKEYLDEGIDNAIIAAFKESDYDIDIKNEIIKVIYINKDAKTNIEIGDQILEINDQKVSSFDEIREYINTLNEKDKIRLKVLNNNKYYERWGILYKDKDNLLKIGIAFHNAYEYVTEIPIKVKMKENESGSSGGLMMSLAIYNALTDKDITKGLNIIGTGSITSDGKVEEIGGVKYKVLAAEKNKGDIFFCPEENYKEAMEVKKRRKLKIKIVKINTLKDAINYLEKE